MRAVTLPSIGAPLVVHDDFADPDPTSGDAIDVTARPTGDAEIDEVFDDVTEPLVGAFRVRAAGDADTFRVTLDRLGERTAHIGGIDARRRLITLTREADRP